MVSIATKIMSIFNFNNVNQHTKVGDIVIEIDKIIESCIFH